jgi:hypothetical protein
MSSEKTSNSHGCCPVKRKKPSLGTQTGSRIKPRACLWVSPRTRHHIQCWLTNQRLVLLRISCLENLKAGSGPTKFRTEPSLATSSAISLPRKPACPGTQCNPTACRVMYVIESSVCFLGKAAVKATYTWWVAPIWLDKLPNLSLDSYQTKKIAVEWKRNDWNISLTFKSYGIWRRVGW